MMRFENAMGVCHIDTLSCHTEGVSPKYPKAKALVCKMLWILRFLRKLRMTRFWILAMTLHFVILRLCKSRSIQKDNLQSNAICLDFILCFLDSSVALLP